MNISTIGQTNPIVGQNLAHSQSNETQSTSQNKSTDSVNISTAAEKSFEADKKLLALPSWFAESQPFIESFDHNTITGASAERRGLNHITDAANSDGVVTRAEKKAINSYQNTMTNSQELKEQRTFNSQHASERNEYAKLSMSALSEAKAEFGLDPNSSFLSGINTSNSDGIGRKYQELLASNPRAVELMGILGIKD